MTLPASLADTDILSELMRGHPEVVAKANEYLREHARLAFAEITRFEILRGLLANPKPDRRKAFEVLCVRSLILPLDAAACERAAEIHAFLRKSGSPIGDADCLIAGTALAHGLALATNNEAHFSKVPGLQVSNWKRTKV